MLKIHKTDDLFVTYEDAKKEIEVKKIIEVEVKGGEEGEVEKKTVMEKQMVPIKVTILHCDGKKYTLEGNFTVEFVNFFVKNDKNTIETCLDFYKKCPDFHIKLPKKG